MRGSVPLDDRRTKNLGQTIREPPLRLAGFPGAERFANLGDDHPAYTVARFAWHYAEGLDASARRALFATLIASWPRKQGRHGTSFDDSRAALAADHLGVGPSEIAAAWTIEPDTANRKIRRGRAAGQPSEDGSPRIVLVEDYLGLDRVEILSEPRDPADLLEGALPGDAPTPEQVVESRARLADAAAMGLPERVELDICLPHGPVTVQVPTASREAAWQPIDRVLVEHGGDPRDGVALTGADEHAVRAAVWLLAECR